MSQNQNSTSVADKTTEYYKNKMSAQFDTGEDVKSDSEANNSKHSEGRVAKAIESQTTKLPSDTFLWLALGSIGVSAALQIMGEKERSTFVGQWAPTFLVLGLYNKMVKILGSEPNDRQNSRRNS